MSSIRRRLLVFSLPALIGLLVLAAASSYFQSKHEISEIFDYHLREIAESLREHSSLAVDELDQYDLDTPEIILQISDRTLSATSATRAGPRLPPPPATGFRNVTVDGRVLRVFSLVTPARVIQVAQPRDVRNHAGAEIAAVSVLPVALALPLVVLIVWLAVGSGLKPLERLATDVASRTADTLEPLPIANLPSEVQPLVKGLNGLLDRLAAALEAQRAIVADAAHELRSPMTALRLQLDLLEGATTPAARAAAMSNLKAGLERGIRMVEQLLALARLDPQVTFSSDDVDLLTIAKEAVVAQSVFAENRNIDLGLATSAAVKVRADRASLATMLSNLIDNAVRYTPAGGRVDVAVHRDAAEAIVDITDSGPGIPETLRERVFHRFDRGEQASGSGSGLGLAIAKRVVERLGGSIVLSSGESGRGLRVRVRLPQVTR